MKEIIDTYYRNNAMKLRRLVDHILERTGTGDLPDRDDFYSLANEVFVDVLKNYDTSRSFDVFLYSCLCNRIKSEIRRQNRRKRMAERRAVSIDIPIDGEEGMVLADVIASPFDLEGEVIGESSCRSGRVEQYLQKLSQRQRAVVLLLAESYRAGEVQKILHITGKEYSDALAGIRSYENVSLLFILNEERL